MKPSTHILGVPIHNLSTEKLVDLLQNFLLSTESRHIVTPNPEFCVEASQDEEFLNILRSAELSLPDGFGLQLIGRLRGERLNRITGVDMVSTLAEVAAREGSRVQLLGGRDGVAYAAAVRLKRDFPELRIVGAENERTPSGRYRSERELVEHIARRRPDILLVAFGAPKQEKWIARNLPSMPSVKVAAGIGGAFDYISGRTKRAPNLMRQGGLEWLYRLGREPRRLKRILNATVIFTYKALTEKKS
ncbi:MAG: WecB/TagA/CpsF family glycosyltransferase [bacterium]|nr:WecB/TagA/CpsF family glycosyltransferase [bacterium]